MSRKKASIYLMIAAISITCIAWNVSAFGRSESEDRKITYLLEQIGSSDLTFIRSGTLYTGPQAKAHLQMKLDYAENRIVTVDDFIEQIASKSYLTGEPYYIQLRDGAKIEAALWLKNKLAGWSQANAKSMQIPMTIESAR